MVFGNPLGEILTISMCMQNFINNIFVWFKRGPLSLYQNLELGKASTDEKWHLAIPWARSCQYQCVSKILSKYSSWFEGYEQFSQTDKGRTHNFANCYGHTGAIIVHTPKFDHDLLRVLQLSIKCSFVSEIACNDKFLGLQ